jgi:hypothetical protein
MPLHDWARVDACIFHSFHNGWIVHLKESLNSGLLPKEYYAISETDSSRQRTLTIRHVTGHRIVALLEIVSPANKDRRQHVDDFVAKVTSALEQGVHVTVADLFAPGSQDPTGMNGAIWQALDESGEPFAVPAKSPLALAAYVADNPVEIYLRYTTIGRPLPNVPLFLTPDHYVDLPLERTYETAFRGMPEVWRTLLESPSTKR